MAEYSSALSSTVHSDQTSSSDSLKKPVKSSVSSVRVLFDVLESALKDEGSVCDEKGSESNKELCQLAIAYSLPTFLESFLKENR